MSTKIRYRTKGTCASYIDIDIDKTGIINSVRFNGGCSGNTQGVAALVQGMDAHEAIDKLLGIQCGARITSCPDQLALALRQALGE